MSACTSQHTFSPRALTLVVVVAALLACKSKIGGTVSVDGKAFEIESCRSGEAMVPQFSGIELIDKSGGKLRLVALPSGQASVSLNGEQTAEACGPITVQKQSSKVNDVSNVEGNAKLDCSGGGHEVKGAVQFENCH